MVTRNCFGLGVYMYLIVSIKYLVDTELLLCIIGPRKARESVKHFGLAPGVPHSKTKWVSNYKYSEVLVWCCFGWKIITISIKWCTVLLIRDLWKFNQFLSVIVEYHQNLTHINFTGQFVQCSWVNCNSCENKRHLGICKQETIFIFVVLNWNRFAIEAHLA